MTPCSFKCDYQHLKEAHCFYLPTKRLYSPTRLHGIIRQMPIPLTSYANFHPQCFDFYTHGEQENNDVEIRCSGLRPFVITHLNTTVSTFRDWQRQTGMKPRDWRFGFRHCRATAQVTLRSVKLRLSRNDV
jgi:hypothetical protein